MELSPPGAGSSESYASLRIFLDFVRQAAGSPQGRSRSSARQLSELAFCLANEVVTATARGEDPGVCRTHEPGKYRDLPACPTRGELLSPDSLAQDLITDQFVGYLFHPVTSVALGSFLLLPACIALIVIAVSAFGAQKKRTKPRWFLLIIAIAVLPVLFIADGVRNMQDWDPKPPAAVENAKTVQEWAMSSYGVSVEESEAKKMARQILGKATRTGQEYTVEGPGGILEVRLRPTEDRTFHMVQTAAEVKLPEVQN